MFVLPNLSAGGAERVTLNFIRQLEPSSYKVDLVVFDKTPDLLSLVPSIAELTDLKTFKASRSLFRLYKTIRRLKPDFVYSSHSRVAVLLALIKLVDGNFRFIARVPSMPSLEREQGYTKPVTAKLYAWAFKCADAVLAQTVEMKDDVAAEYGVKAEKIMVASNPLDTRFINEKLKGVNSPFRSDEINIVASGRHSREKGFDILLEAFASVVSNIPNAKLTVLGREGEQTSVLTGLVEKYSLQNSVTFTGFTDNPYLYYQYCDVFVLSSRWEGYPNALLENYYLNTPLVATQCVPVVARLVKNEVNGFAVPNDPQPASLSDYIIKALSLKRNDIKNELVASFDFNKLLESEI
nr:glycosyltransferase [Oleiphilus sp. HI0125]